MRGWDAIAADIGGGWTGEALECAVRARLLRHDDARKALAARRINTLPSVAIGASADSDHPHQVRGALARRLSAVRRSRDPLEDMIHPSALRS